MLCKKSAAPKVEVVLETDAGSITIVVCVTEAPASARAFLALVEDDSFTRCGSFYRTVRKNENDRKNPAIDIIQGGWLDAPSSLLGIEHESTQQSGLRHLDGTVSLARDGAGTATGAAFFICIGDQPVLDAGGSRSADRLGFAAFGEVTQGMEIVLEIHRCATGNSTKGRYQSAQILDPPVRILRASRKVCT